MYQGALDSSISLNPSSTARLYTNKTKEHVSYVNFDGIYCTSLRVSHRNPSSMALLQVFFKIIIMLLLFFLGYC